MEITTYILTAVLAVVLIGVAIRLCWRKPPGSPSTVTALLSIAFLMILLLHMSKFKHVKGFGFDAETWDQKQVEAAKLVDQLSNVSEALSQQLALVTSRLGTWYSGLSNPELATLLRQIDKQLQDNKNTSKIKRDEILAPLRHRILINYWIAARNLIHKAYKKQVQELEKVRTDDTQQRISALVEERMKIDSIPTPTAVSFDLESLIATFKNSKLFTSPNPALTALDELEQDVRFFNANEDNKLRREIDLEKQYPSAPILLGD